MAIFHCHWHVRASLLQGWYRILLTGDCFLTAILPWRDWNCRVSLKSTRVAKQPTIFFQHIGVATEYIIGNYVNTSWPFATQIARFMGPTWVPPGSCGPQVGPMLAPSTLLSGDYEVNVLIIIPAVMFFHTRIFPQMTNIAFMTNLTYSSCPHIGYFCTPFIRFSWYIYKFLNIFTRFSHRCIPAPRHFILNIHIVLRSDTGTSSFKFLIHIDIRIDCVKMQDIDMRCVIAFVFF